MKISLIKLKNIRSLFLYKIQGLSKGSIEIVFKDPKKSAWLKIRIEKN